MPVLDDCGYPRQSCRVSDTPRKALSLGLVQKALDRIVEIVHRLALARFRLKAILNVISGDTPTPFMTCEIVASRVPTSSANCF
jgi:hypothetical protein